MLSLARPRFRAEEIESRVREIYRLEVEVIAELPSERDQNFHLRDASGGELVFKIASSSESTSILDLQSRALEQVRLRDPELPVPRLRPTADGESFAAISDASGASHLGRLFEYLPGRPLGSISHHPEDLLRGIGRLLGRLDRALEGFSHEAQSRELKWNPANAHSVIEDGIALVDSPEKKDLLRDVSKRFAERIAPVLASLPRGVVHNDPNDYNLLVEDDRVTGLLDFGDLVESAFVCDAAHACVYVMLRKRDPLAAARAVVSGYHQERPLENREIELLFPLIATRLAMSVSISARQYREEPDKEYLRVSEKDAWELLARLRTLSERFAYYGFRAACGLPPHPRSAEIAAALDAAPSANVLPWDLSKTELRILDLSIGSNETMHRPEGAVGVGRYDEARLCYTTEAFQPKDGEARTVHLGIDLFVDPGCEVRAPLAGRVHSFAFNDRPLDYGPTIVLEHDPGFFTLYGHLSLDSLEGLEPGRPVAKGAVIGRVGRFEENGNWPPHLHFQIVLDMLDQEGDFPGVASPSEREIWLGLSPDPSRLLGLPKEARAARRTVEDLRLWRTKRISPALSVAYARPLHLVRGIGSYLYDADGRRYLDMVNNVCHVGHSHPRVVAALARQASVLNTNTRYLHENLLELAERITSLLPAGLEVAFFVNSGSEANDLALRLARTHLRRKDTFVFDGAYHGNLTSLVEVSPYKFDGPGGEGAPSFVHKLPMADGYRGVHRRSDPGYAARWVEDARRVVEASSPGALLAEAIPSCGGQVVLPPGYLRELFRAVKEAGGVSIGDEVQTGFGRIGSRFWAFEAEDAVPDIVSMGKPMGNGHPLGCVVTTREIASSFRTGMEYFNTFGGNPVSCAVGLAVLDAIQEEKLQERALRTGELLLSGLRELQKSHPILGDVRGKGLFLGFELVRDRESLEPAASEASHLVQRMRDEGILLSTEGPLGNVVKAKPPLAFGEREAEIFLDKLANVLREDRFQR